MWPRTFCIIHNFSFFVDGSNRSNLWTAHDPLPDNDRQYGFTLFSMSLNEKNDSKKEREGGRERERERGREGYIYSSCTCTTYM